MCSQLNRYNVYPTRIPDGACDFSFFISSSTCHSFVASALVGWWAKGEWYWGRGGFLVCFDNSRWSGESSLRLRSHVVYLGNRVKASMKLWFSVNSRWGSVDEGMCWENGKSRDIYVTCERERILWLLKLLRKLLLGCFPGGLHSFRLLLYSGIHI